MGQDPQLIRQQNEHTREELAADLDALGDKLDVKRHMTNAKDGMVDKVKEKVGMNTSRDWSHGAQQQQKGMGGTIMSAATSSPIGTLALAYGLKSLWGSFQKKQRQNRQWQHYSQRGYGYQQGYGYTGGYGYASQQGTDDGNGVRGTIGNVAGKVTGAGSTVTDKVSGVGSTITDKASGVGSTLADTTTGFAGQASGFVTQHAPTSTDEWAHMIRTNIPAVGIGALALGAIAGMAAPTTHFEEERLGQFGENLKDQVTDKVQDVASQAQDAVKSGVDTAKEQMGGSSQQQTKQTTSPATTRPTTGVGSGNGTTRS